LLDETISSITKKGGSLSNSEHCQDLQLGFVWLLACGWSFSCLFLARPQKGPLEAS